MNDWKDSFLPPFIWALLAFVEVVSFTAIIPALAPELTESQLYNLWVMLVTATITLVTATITRIRTPNTKGANEDK
jgi:uncharacterized membrane protein YhaH (DUF805 family)